MRKDFIALCSLPFWRLFEMPLWVLTKMNQWAISFLNWLSDNTIMDWMNDLKDERPLIFWLSGIIWIPILIVVGFYGICLFFNLAFLSIISVIAFAFVFAVVCKITYIILKITTFK